MVFLDLVGHQQKGLFDVGGVLGRGFDERDLERIGESTARVGGDGALVDEIALVADQELLDGAAGEGVDLLEPLLDVVERLLVGDVVDHDDAVRSSVVAASDGAEALLSGRVPDLKLDLDAADGHSADLEVDSDGGDEGVSEDVVRES